MPLSTKASGAASISLFLESERVCRSVMSDSTDCSPPRLFHAWDSPGKNIGVGCHFLLQGIFPTEGLNLGLLNCG